MKNKLIVWEKWVDPFDPENLDIENQDEYSEEEESELDAEAATAAINGSMKVIMTPIGMLPIDILSTSDKFNFWVGHTNFDITPGVANTIEESHGVEVLDILTRYRFRIAIGKIFTDRDVMKEINDHVYEYIDKNHE
jgi:hypothetical protein